MDLRASGSSIESQSLPIAKRTRRGTAKSRQGCSACKARRIKCDESRPSCRNCLKIGSQCPGFQQRLRWSKKHERATTAAFNEARMERSSGSGDPPFQDQAARMNDSTSTVQSNNAQDVTSIAHSLHDALSSGIAPDWQVASPTWWQATDPDLVATLNDDSLASNMVVGLSGPSEEVNDHLIIPNPQRLQMPVHLPTLLIEHWFRYVCPMRSTYDSDINYNRQMAATTWSTSEAVSCTMQAMSAAYLVDSMPQLRETLPSLSAQAVTAINKEMSQIRASPLPKVSADLVFAVFALGSSLHWFIPGLRDNPWVEWARELLSTWAFTLSATEQLIYAYFTQALTYWEMLLTTMGCGSIPSRVQKRRQKLRGTLFQSLGLPVSDQGATNYGPQPYDASKQLIWTRPNSWCGVSNEVIDVFGQVLALCRSTRLRDGRNGGTTVGTASDILCDLSLAQELQQELLAIDFGTLLLMEEIQGHCIQTQDINTPISHLLQTAEAYRKAAILQLHLTFTDLTMMPQQSSIFVEDSSIDTSYLTTAGQENNPDFVLSLTLQLVAILKKIPAESGSKSIHPMLYLSAAAGLKFNTNSEPINANSLPQGTSGLIDPTSVASFAGHMDQASHNPAEGPRQYMSNAIHQSSTVILQSTIEIARARRLVWTRLSNLQQTLPHGSSKNMLRLVKAIWREYDKPQPSPTSTHWLDVLDETSPGTMLW